MCITTALQTLGKKCLGSRPQRLLLAVIQLLGDSGGKPFLLKDPRADRLVKGSNIAATVEVDFCGDNHASQGFYGFFHQRSHGCRYAKGAGRFVLRRHPPSTRIFAFLFRPLGD
jgi:hypothetical protein